MQTEALFPSTIETGRIMHADMPCRDEGDPRAVPFRAVITGPDGRRDCIGAFLHRPYRRVEGHNGAEVIEPAGDRYWSLRYCAFLPGQYRWTIEERVADGQHVAIKSGDFTASGPVTGPIRRHPVDGRFFAHVDGSLYYPTGENMCWSGKGGLAEYAQWLPKLVKAGGNYIRVWMSPYGTFSIENTRAHPGPDGERGGVGRYLLDQAWRLDQLFDLCLAHGVQVLLCLDSFNTLRAGEPHPAWAANPYNAANQGPCATPGEFFAGERVSALYRERIAYCVRRWGAYPNLMAWQFWNEVDLTESFEPDTVARWHAAMARHVRAIDPFGHLLTTSFAGSTGDSVYRVATIPELDFVQTHTYGGPDTPCEHLDARTNLLCRWWRMLQDKPYYVGEYGIDWAFRHVGEDHHGVALETGAWGSVMAGAAGLPMPWYWETVDRDNLYVPMLAAARFVNDASLVTEAFRPLEFIGTVPPYCHLGVEGRHEIWLYLRHHEYTWRNVEAGRTPAPVADPVWLHVEPSAGYLVKEYDTRTGEVIHERTLKTGRPLIEFQPREPLTTARAYRLIKTPG